MTPANPQPVQTDAGLRARLRDALDALAGRLARDRAELEAARARGETLQAGLETQGAWVREAMSELERLNDLAVAAEARAVAAEADLAQARADLEAAVARQSSWLDDEGAGLYRTLATVQALSAKGAPVFVRPDGLPAFRPTPGPRSARVAVVSAPKAGTYLLGEILKALGFQDSGVHGAAWGFADLRWRDKRDLLARLTSLNAAVALADYIDLVRPSDFLLSHLAPEGETPTLLAGMRKVLAVRDVRTAFASFMRYAVAHDLTPGAEPLRALDGPARMAAFAASAGAEGFFALTRPMAGWIGDAETLLVRYEDLAGRDALATVEAIARHVLAETEAAGDIDMAALLDADTLTASGAPTDLADWWSDDAEAAFVRHGGPDINRAFGYES